LPLVAGSLSSWVTNSSDVYLIGLFLGAAAVGYYSPGYSLGRAITMFSTPFIIMLPPLLSKHYDENNLNEVRTTLTYSWKYYLGVAIPCVFGLSALSKPVLNVISTPSIAANGYMIIPLVAAGALLLGAYEIVVLIITLRKKTVLTGVIWMSCAVFNFGANLVLIPYLGIIGAALTTLMAFALAFSLTALYSFRHFEFDINPRFMAKSVFASIVFAALLLYWSPSGLADILLSISVSAVIYFVTLFALRGFTTKELKFFYGIVKHPF
jgi:O-antigen/teichoic acid export membrane protein